MQRDSANYRLQIGDAAPYFSLKGTDGKIYSLADYSSKRGLLVLFTSNHCPYAQAYEERLLDLAERFADSDIAFVQICSNDGEAFPADSFEQMVEKSVKTGFKIPYLSDSTQSVAKAYDAECTPEALLFDQDLRLFYRGMIDDNHQDAAATESRYLEDALEALVAGIKPETPVTHALGCSIKWKN